MSSEGRLSIYKKNLLDKYQSTFLLSRIWNLVGYLITFFVVSNFLGRVEQGYYYTLNSLIALQVFFELGFSYVIVQKSSHLHSLWVNKPTHDKSCPEYKEASSFFLYIVQWFSCCAFIFIIVLIVVGNSFFSSKTHVNDPLTSIWYFLIVLTALNLILTAVLSFFEGFGKALHIYKIKLFQNIFSQCILWIAIYNGLGLKSIAFSNFTLFVVGIILVLVSFRTDLISLFKARSSKFVYWVKDLFKYQSKVALSWISGYFQFQLLVPIIFHYRGAIDAGRMGNTFTLVSGITALSLSLIQSKSWEYSSLIAVKNYEGVNKIFKKNLLQILFASVFIGIGMYALIIIINYKGYGIAQKVLPPIPFLLFILATIFNVIIAGIAIYLRAFLEEKLMVVSLSTGLSMILLLLLVTPKYGLLGVSIVYLSCTLFIGLLGAVYILRQKLKSLK
ncbi:MAG: hypothetical protein V4553_06020 [Bacteroidota bacterium]